MSKSQKSFGHDKTSFANLPQEVHMSQYPQLPSADKEMDDTMDGIDQAIEHGVSKASKYSSNQK